jgi:predicted histone-like DNA-binding protein
MAFKVKVIEKGKPGVAGGGPKKSYLQIVYDGEATMDDIVKEVEKFSSLSEPDIRGVIIAIENIIQDKLAQGKIVRLERLGTFYPSISSKGETNPSDLSINSIKKVNVNYRPGDRIKKALKDASITKVS